MEKKKPIGYGALMDSPKFIQTFELTMYDLQNMKPHTTFERGVLNDAPTGINLANTGNNVHWVAKRGFISDWAIYVQNPHYGELAWSYEEVENNGDKMFDPKNILKLVDATAQALRAYRL